ncbi:hypothetical protein D3C85_1767690 [compost metagenome]
MVFFRVSISVVLVLTVFVNFSTSSTLMLLLAITSLPYELWRVRNLSPELELSELYSKLA